MCGKYRLIPYKQEARIGQDWKWQYHLIHVGITISPHGRYGDRKVRKHGYDSLGIIFPGKVVARPMIQNISQEQQPPGLFPSDSLHQKPAIISRTMYIRSNHYIHQRHLLLFQAPGQRIFQLLLIQTASTLFPDCPAPVNHNPLGHFIYIICAGRFHTGKI